RLRFTRNEELINLYSTSISRIPQDQIVDTAYDIRSEASTCAISNHGYEVLPTEHFVQQLPHMMDVLIRNLHEHAPRLVQKLPRQQQPVTQIRQIGVNAQLPGIPERLDHFRLLGQVLVLAVFDVA